jgi:hypothetical protein
MEQKKYFTRSQLQQDPSITRILTPIPQKEFKQAQKARKQGVAVLASNLAFLEKMEKIEKKMEKRDKIKSMSVPQLKQEISKQKTAVKNLEKKIAAEEFLNAFMPSAYKKTVQNTPKLKTLYEHHKKLAKSLATLERELSVKALKAFLATRGAPKTKSAPAKRVPASVSVKSASAVIGGATVPRVVVKPVVLATTVLRTPVQEQLIIMSTKPIPRNAVQARVILEVPIDADGVVIKNSFHRLSRKYHPDKHPKHMEKNATQAITRINRAYEILTK